MKRGSITLYFVLGLAIIILIGLFFLFDNSNKNNQLLIDTEGSASLESEQNLLDTTIKFCVKQTLIEAELAYGLSKVFSTKKIEEYMNKNLGLCLGDFNQFDKLGYVVKKGQVSSKIQITNEAIVVDISYPLTFSRKGVQIKFDKQTYRFSRIVTEKIEFEKSTRIVSADGSTIIEMEPGTTATLNGKAIDEIGIKLLDRGFNGQSNSVLAGSMAYTGIPHGAQFSKPIKITHFYKDEDIHHTINENTLRMGYFDDELGMWVGLPAEVDPVNNKITIETTHFSPYGVVLRCGIEETNKVEIDIGVLIKEKCGPCDDEYWVNKFEEDDYNGLGECLKNDDIESPEIFTSNKILEEKEKEFNKYEIGDEEDIYDDEVLSCLDDIVFDTEKENCVKPESDSDVTYYAYETIKTLKGRKEVLIDFSKGGDACIASESLTISVDDTDDDTEEKKDFNPDEDSQHIEISCFDTKDDNCNVRSLEGDLTSIMLDEYKLEFEVLLENNDEKEDQESPPNKKIVDACLNGNVKLTINGFGIDDSNSYKTQILCDENIATSENPYKFISSINDEISGVCSVCQKEDQEDDDPTNDYYAWASTGEENCGEEDLTGEPCDTQYLLDLRDEGCFVCDGDNSESLSWVKDESDPNKCVINQCAFSEVKT